MAISCYSSSATVRDVDPSSVGMMEGAFFVSRTELLDWVNNSFNLSLTKVEQAASGAVYLQIVDALYNGHACVVPMAKVKWNCKHDYEYIHNYKLLQAVFTKKSIKKHIEVDRLIKGKYQDNLEFLQWLKAFYDRQAPAQQQQRPPHSKPYNARERRKLAGSIFPEWAQPSVEGCSSSCSAVTAAGGEAAAGGGGRKGSTPLPSFPSAALPARQDSSSLKGGGAAAAAGVPAPSSSASLGRCSSNTAAVAAAPRGCSSARLYKQPPNSSGDSETSASSSQPQSRQPSQYYYANSENSSNSSHPPTSIRQVIGRGSRETTAATAAGEEHLLLVQQLQQEIGRLKELNIKLETEGEQAWLEREFYFRKLRKLEIMCTTPGVLSLTTKEVLAVLYATEDEAETQATAADDGVAAAETFPDDSNAAQQECSGSATELAQNDHGQEAEMSSTADSSSIASRGRGTPAAATTVQAATALVQ